MVSAKTTAGKSIRMIEILQKMMMSRIDSYQLNLAKGTQEIFYNARKASGGKGFRGINSDSNFCSRKAAKLAKKNN